MCLTVNYGATFKVAQEDITVYKIGAIDGDSYLSKYRGYCYRKDEVQPSVKIKICSLEFAGEKYVYEGYHSFTSLREVNIHHVEDRGKKIGVFTIPKGSLYIEGTFVGSKNYVSETLIFNGEYKKKSLLKRFFNY